MSTRTRFLEWPSLASRENRPRRRRVLKSSATSGFVAPENSTSCVPMLLSHVHHLDGDENSQRASWNWLKPPATACLRRASGRRRGRPGDRGSCAVAGSGALSAIAVSHGVPGRDRPWILCRRSVAEKAVGELSKVSDLEIGKQARFLIRQAVAVDIGSAVAAGPGSENVERVGRHH